MKRERLNLAKCQRVNVGILVPAVSDQEEIPHPARRQRRQFMPVELDEQLISGIHDRILIVDRPEQGRDAAVPGEEAFLVPPMGGAVDPAVVEPMGLRPVGLHHGRKAPVVEVRPDRSERMAAQRHLLGTAGIEDVIPVDLHGRDDPHARIGGVQLTGEVDHHGLVLARRQADVGDRTPATASIGHGDPRRDHAHGAVLRHCHVDTGIGRKDPPLQKEPDMRGIGPANRSRGARRTARPTRSPRTG